MALDPPLSLIVHIQKPPAISLGQTMNDIRSWLDHRKIEPVSFRPVAIPGTDIAFEICFKSVEDASSFRQELAQSGEPAKGEPAKADVLRLVV